MKELFGSLTFYALRILLERRILSLEWYHESNILAVTRDSISIIIVVNFFHIRRALRETFWNFSSSVARHVIILVGFGTNVGMHVSRNCKIFTANTHALNMTTIIINYMVRNLVTRRRIQRIGKQIVFHVMAFSMVFKWYVMKHPRLKNFMQTLFYLDIFEASTFLWHRNVRARHNPRPCVIVHCTLF